jgi:hypothetical protein
VRPRWQEFVIVASILGILATGVMTIWWDDIHGMFSSNKEDEQVKKPAEAPVPPPAGPAQGPF